MAWLAFCGLGLVALILATFRDSATAGFTVTPGTNVARVSVQVTQGTTHVYYYRGKIRWMWNDLCKRFGWRILADAQQQRSSTYQAADMLWLTCHHRGEPLDPRLFRCWEVTADGTKKVQNTTGGIRDKKRGVSVSHWALPGGIEKHRGSVLHVKYGTRELARIDIR